MAYSSDGITWTAIAAGTGVGQSGIASSYAVNRVAWGGGKFVAAGTLGKTAYSSDGIAWTGGTAGASAITDIAWGNGMFIVTGGNAMYRSSDGAVWTVMSQTPAAWGMATDQAVSLKSAAWDGGKFVVRGGYLITGYSRDGEEWYRVPPVTSSSTDTINGIAWNGARLVAVGSSGRIFYTD
jgi:hypothetical protein